MKDTFLFFDFKRSKLINILLVLQIALWLFYASSLISLLKFDISYKHRYTNSLPIDTAQLITFSKMIIKNSSDETQLQNTTDLKNILKYLDNNNYKYGLLLRESKNSIPFDVLKVSLNTIKPNFNRTKERYDNIYPIYMNSGMLNNYLKNIDGSISISDWNYNNSNIPVILGSSFSKSMKINDAFDYNNKKYIVKGFFKENTLAFDYTNIVDSSFLLNDSFVIPLDINNYVSNFNYEPISVYLTNEQNDNIINFKKDISKISSNISLSNFKEDLDVFLEELNSKRIFETVRILIISLTATASIITTIGYKILKDKDRIGVLYCIGINKVKIFKTLSFEFLIYVFIGIILGSLFYMKNCKDVYAFFINENLIPNLYTSMFILILIILLILLSSFKLINKLTPKEMVGGFKE